MDRLEPRAGGAQHQIGVPARPDQRVGAEEVIVGEVVAGGRELALVAGSLVRVEAPPCRVQAQESELDEVPLGHAS